MKMFLVQDHFLAKSTSFSYEKFSAQTRFQTEAQGDLKMAYYEWRVD